MAKELSRGHGSVGCQKMGVSHEKGARIDYQNWDLDSGPSSQRRESRQISLAHLHQREHVQGKVLCHGIHAAMGRRLWRNLRAGHQIYINSNSSRRMKTKIHQIDINTAVFYSSPDETVYIEVECFQMPGKEDHVCFDRTSYTSILLCQMRSYRSIYIKTDRNI